MKLAMLERGAVLSDCGLYRYRLTRRWAAGSTCCFVMLNPSTADAMQDDPTIRRCINFARAWGHGALVVVNLYAFRATDPMDLQRAEDPSGPDNAMYVERETARAGQVVVAWGAHPWARATIAATLVHRPAFALALNGDGSPKHPLYVRGDATPVEWKP